MIQVIPHSIVSSNDGDLISIIGIVDPNVSETLFVINYNYWLSILRRPELDRKNIIHSGNCHVFGIHTGRSNF